ncbi:MAG: diacylglycerol O-acyltransferase [Myxococcota bacterium]|jgi:diacylglycerol O-acyltransferase
MATEHRLTPNDAMFLYGESDETMMHVATLMRFARPEGADANMLRDLIEEVYTVRKLDPPWNMQLKHPGFLRHPAPSWVEVDEVDVEYHVRRSGLPSPGGERELGVLVSRLHGLRVDFARPPWETHLIEGLEGGQFGLYTKLHHSLVDGFTGSKMLAASFSRTPEERTPLFFNQPRPGGQRPPREPTSPWRQAWEAIKTQVNAAGEVAGTVRELAESLVAGDPQLTGGIVAPKSILNGRIGRNRRFATQQFDLAHLKRISKASGGTLNDLVLALCAGGLRRFLLELGALPDRPLVAMLPVAVRAKDDPGGGNAVGAILATLATHIQDPWARLEAIISSTRRAKERLGKLSRPAMIQLSALTMAPTGVQAITGRLGRSAPQFNVCISNVPGPSEQLYFRGASLEAVYPVSVPVHGLALNITCYSYNGTLNFGFTGCRDTLPHMQRLAVYTGEALRDLETALEPGVG